MALANDFQTAFDALRRLGPRKLAALGMTGAFVFLLTGIAGYLLSRPQFETLYTGLDKQESSRIAAALREANVNFDLSSDGAALLVEYGQTSRARMLLAERGLPGNSGGGYEIFDKLGSLGLTSFMQDITRVRALEGELARTIQAMQGVRAARVHLVMPDEGSFRRTKQAASASVVVRLSTSSENAVAQAIRHLVASAVPGMTIDLVTVLSADGAILASGSDGESGTPARAAKLERAIADGLQDNIRRTLTPMLGLRNLNVSVAVRLNTDKRQVNETIYNPESRVERSVRVIKENQTAQNSSNQGATGVERNIPAGGGKSGDGRQSNEENQKREELTNYEVSTKQVSTTSSGYSIERLSVAVLVNRAGLAAGLGDKANDQDAMDKKVTEIGELVSSAEGLMKERGDVVKVTAVNFADLAGEMEPVAGPGIVQTLTRQIGFIVSGLAIMGAIVLLGLFVVRPVAQSLIVHAEQAPAQAVYPAALAAPGDVGAIVADYSAQGPGGAIHMEENPLTIGQRRIDDVVAADEAQAAAMLKQWMRKGAQA